MTYTIPTQDTVGEFNSTTVFNADGSITQTNTDSGVLKTTVFNTDGSITETWNDSVPQTKTTTFGADGTITETIS